MQATAGQDHRLKPFFVVATSHALKLNGMAEGLEKRQREKYGQDEKYRSNSASKKILAEFFWTVCKGLHCLDFLFSSCHINMSLALSRKSVYEILEILCKRL